MTCVHYDDKNQQLAFQVMTKSNETTICNIYGKCVRVLVSREWFDTCNSTGRLRGHISNQSIN